MPTPFNSKYSSTEIENFFDLLNSNSFITNTVSNLVNYYLKSDTYSKSEIDSIINTIKNGRFQNVNSLPEQDIDTNVIYLVQKQNTESNNIKDEYINLDGTSSGWEKIGSTEINLDGYVTIQALNTALSNYVQSSNIVTILANRTSFSSIENMVATSATDLYDGCLAYVTATKKNYQYDSTNEADPTLGKWRELQTGGGGGSSYTAGDGIDITDDVISTKQSEEGDIDEIVDVYPTAGNLVSIVNAFNKGDIYSTQEKMIGQWTDGKPLYQKTITTIVSTTQVDDEFLGSIADTLFANDIEMAFVIGDKSYYNISNTATRAFDKVEYETDDKKVYFWTHYARTNVTAHFTLQYTKTTDVAISIGEATEYSTDEKIIGTWVDGKPLYQKTITGTISSISNIEFTPIGATIDKVASIQGIAFVNGQASLLPFFNDAMNVKVALTVNTDSVSSDKNSVFCYATGTSPMVGQPYFATLQYTKTTT